MQQNSKVKNIKTEKILNTPHKICFFQKSRYNKIMKKLNFTNPYSNLPPDFYTKMDAERFAQKPFLIHANIEAAKNLDLTKEDFSDENFAKYFSGNKNLENSEPLAMAYSGHQFGVFAGRLGDGRALLLGQVENEKNELWDVVLKGSGKTPYSRFGDGRAVLRSCIREYLCSQALVGLDISTTQALCIIGTDEFALRETLEPAAILTRLAKSHIRFGHFEHFFYLEQFENLKILADYVIKYHFSDISLSDEKCYEKMLEKVTMLTAKLIAKWQAVGFCHGVMNTDNMSIIGDTIDFGPFGFLEKFDQDFVCNHSDTAARYSYNKQPTIALWNLHALAYALSPLIDFEDSKKILKNFEIILQKEYKKLISKKLGLQNSMPENDQLISELLQILDEEKPDYTLCFRYLSDVFENEEKWLSLFDNQQKAKNWLKNYKLKIENTQNFQAEMKQNNPKFILRNWVAELCIREAQDKKNYKMIDDVLKILQNPFGEHLEFEHLSNPAPEAFQDLCVSCSS